VAHELNNPLTSVIGYAQLLEDELVNPPDGTSLRPAGELAQDVRHIAEESERAARIVRNLLAFARRQTAARAPQDLAELCSRVLALRAYELRLNSVAVTAEFPAGLPAVIADSGQLQQAVLNLVLNAEQAMRGRPVKRLTLGARFDEVAGAVELRVTDTGHGIAPPDLSRIFDPFFTTRGVGEGTGLGLSICYGIVRDHGGHIRAESTLQAGTTFTVLLPARLRDPGLAVEEILVAHESQGERDFLAAALAAWGYRAWSASTAEQALERYRAGGLHAVFLDRGLLGADLDGWRLARGADAGATPLVLMSMTPHDGEIERFGREQASAVLVPPFELRALRSALRAVAEECV
jgi:CheY-like chemotaxis protein